MNNIKSIVPNAPADFTPTLGNYKDLHPFRYWCNKVLPLVYDDSLSYYELLCKVVDYLNKTMEDVETLHGDVTNLRKAYEELQGYVNEYFSALDVQEEINNKLDELVSNGTMQDLISKAISQRVQVSQFNIYPGLVSADDIEKLNEYLADNPNTAIEFGLGKYELSSPIIAYQGTNIYGCGIGSIIASKDNNWCIEINGLSGNNLFTIISEITLQSDDFSGNGIFINGKAYSRTLINNVSIIGCKNGVLNALNKDTLGSGNGGNIFNNIYIYGDAPNDDSSKCENGMRLFTSDNYLSNVRISGYGEYGLYIAGTGNQFINVKTAVNHIGGYITGAMNKGELSAEECFNENIILEYIRGGSINIKSSASWCIAETSFPSNLSGSAVIIKNCSNSAFTIHGILAQKFANRVTSEAFYLEYEKCLSCDINVYVNNTNNPSDIAYPVKSVDKYGNNVKINCLDVSNFINYPDVILTSVNPTNATVTGEYPNFTTEITANGRISIAGFDIQFDVLSKEYFLTATVLNNQPFSFYLQPNMSDGTFPQCDISVFRYSFSKNGGICAKFTLNEILNNNPDYVTSVQNGATINALRLFIICDNAIINTSKINIRMVKLN